MAQIHANTMYRVALFIGLLLNSCVFGYNSWTEYWEAYEASAYFPRLYPYKEEFHDHSYNDGDGFDAAINFHIPYFGKYYKSAHVTKEGSVKLGKEVSPTYTQYYPQTPLPNQNYPEEQDPPLITPFYTSWELMSADPGQIFWRRLDPEEQADAGQKEIVEGMLEVLSQEVRRHVVGGDRFHADKGLIVTWNMMTFYGCIPNPICPTNTIQMALVTEEFGTYVIYNYYNVTWSGGTMDLCDPFTGLVGATSPFDQCFPAQAGFNEGEGRHFLELPHSNTHDVVDLDTKGATGVQGRYIYDATHPTIVRGGCTNETELNAWKLEVYPVSVSMFGGTTVYFSGPCLLPGQEIRCRFASQVVHGMALPESSSKGMCVSPMLDRSGWTDFCVSTDGGNAYSHCTRLHISPKYYHWTKIQLHNENGEWYNRVHGQLSLEWNPQDLVFFHEEGDCVNKSQACNDTAPADIHVDIALIGYKEELNVNGTLQGSWKDLHTFTTSVPNTGEFTFNTADHQCTVDCGWENPHIGLIKISVSTDPEYYVRSIYSEPVPLGWYLNSAMIGQHGDNWPELKCIDWAATQSEDQPWRDEVVPCPMTKSQAYTDIGRFIYPNPDCDPGEPCPMKPRPEPHIECVESVVSTFGKYGSGSTCCYSEDGDLLYGQDTPQGSAATHTSPYAFKDDYDMKVTPWMSHWSRDREPYVLCCHWSGEGICREQYMSHRKPRTDTHYTNVKYGTGYGDPHFTTYDGNEYMFNGHGEFWLLQIEGMPELYDNFAMQVRLQQPQDQYGYAVNASVITAVVMQEGWSIDQQVSRIQVELNDVDATSQLAIYVSGAMKEFDTPDLMYQEIYSLNGRRTIIQNNDHHHSNHQSNFTVIFQNGITVQTANRDGFLQLVVVLPEKYFGMTNGILGTWNDDPTDDLRTPDGQVIPADDLPENIHNDFGMRWEVGMADSFFIYRGKADWEYFRDPDFVPNFREPEKPPHNITDEEVNAVCGESFICRFDYKTTMSKHVANTSLYLQMWTNEARHFTEKVLTCGYLEIPRGHRTVDKYTVGGYLKVTGCEEGYTLLGETDYNCVQVNENDATWQPSPDAECKSNEEIDKEQQMLITAIVVPIVLIMILAVLAAVGFIYYRKRQKQPQDGTTKKPPKSSMATDRNQQFEDLALSASMSQSLASVNNSFGSIVLTEQLQTARPPRPQSMQIGQQHPVAGHAQLGNVPYAPNTSRGSYDNLLAKQGYSLSPAGQVPQNVRGNRSMDNRMLNQSAGQYSGQPNKSFENGDHANRSLDSMKNGQVNQSFDHPNSQVNRPVGYQNRQVNRSFDQVNGKVNRSFDQQNGAMSSRAASQTSLSQLPQGRAGVANPGLAGAESDSSEDIQESLNSSRNGTQAVYTMNGFGDDTVV